ncbi:MAG: hypothetical protein ACHP7D_08000, partial [Lysobacterales bacterium]
MFALLRNRLRARPELRAPLRSAEWNGDRLILGFETGCSGEIALDLDGAFFSATRIDNTSRARFEFGFAPSAQAAFDAMPRLGR